MRAHCLSLEQAWEESMAEMVFWGEHGEYGPFTKQEDGWPAAGEVIRHYRRKLNMSAEELAQQYSKAIDTPITVRWIFKMEQQNKVPTDITRRRALSRILGIPPILLGLASLEQLSPDSKVGIKAQSTPVVLKNTPAIDIVKYDQFVHACWMLSYTGEESLKEITANIQELEKLEHQSREELQKQVRKILNSHYQLASDITRHRGDFLSAWSFANNAVRVTKCIGVNDLLTSALYRRGYTNLEWATWGNNTASAVINREPDRKRIEAAIVNFERALPLARPQLKGAIWIELSRAQGILKNTSIGLSLISSAENMVGSGSRLHDPIDQILLEGALNGLNEGMFLVGKVAFLITIGRTETALETIDDLYELKNGKGIASNQTRRLAYVDALHAEASFREKDYITSCLKATSAFKTFRDINTVERIAHIHDLYKRLVEKCGKQAEVKELGILLMEHKKYILSQK